MAPSPAESASAAAVRGDGPVATRFSPSVRARAFARFPRLRRPVRRSSKTPQLARKARTWQPRGEEAVGITTRLHI